MKFRRTLKLNRTKYKINAMTHEVIVRFNKYIDDYIFTRNIEDASGTYDIEIKTGSLEAHSMDRAGDGQTSVGSPGLVDGQIDAILTLISEVEVDNIEEIVNTTLDNEEEDSNSEESDEELVDEEVYLNISL